MNPLHYGVTPKMKPVPPKRTAVVAALDIGTSKIACLVARLKPHPPQEVLRRRSHGVEILGIAHTHARGMKAGAVVDLAQTEAAIGALFKGGVTIVPGSDTGLVGYGLQRELEIYVEAGMTPLEAIQSATIVSARAMKLDAELGTVEVGKLADLIVIAANPLDDITNVRQLQLVLKEGRVVSDKRHLSGAVPQPEEVRF